MENHRVGLSEAGPSSHHITYGTSSVPPPIPNSNFIHQDGSAFDFGELEQAIVLQGVHIDDDHHVNKSSSSLFSTRPATTLKMFPSWPIGFQQNTPIGGISSKSGEDQEDSTDSGSAVNAFSSHLQQPESPISCSSDHNNSNNHHLLQLTQNQQQYHQMASPRTGLSPPVNDQVPLSKPNHEKKKGPRSSSETLQDAKTLRRLAQNREAAKKSRLRKKAYVHQLETSRIKLAQLEQDLHRARSQGLFLGGGVAACGNISSGAAMFDMEYSRWLDDDHRHMAQLRAGIQAQFSDEDLRLIVDGYIAHYDEIFHLREVAAKTDVFHLITGMWTTPAERCFLWMGGFRPSELIKMLMAQLDPLTENQVIGIYSLQHSSQQAEEALSQGLEQLQQSLVNTISGGGSLSDHGMHHMTIGGPLGEDGMHPMAVALDKLSNLEGFVRQADNFRQQIIHQLHRILTVRQAARCFLAIGEYYVRLRALSSLWSSRPRESLIVDDGSCQTASDVGVGRSSQNNFSNF
ncbi:transcription factor TGA9-like [Impatiens glandulifera]|uniref:transcription factor TGA9-like n=1 Tax=Impatiens glandulifera TaxID=253017 RepID=UPI001FB10D7D|nr:transcription factor TGA9-like [Impatiens glandulifera]